MRFAWSDEKRKANLRQHGLDFIDAPKVFDGATVTLVDDRFAYAEERFLTLGLRGETVVSIVHTETQDTIRIISFRKATRHEQAIFFGNI